MLPDGAYGTVAAIHSSGILFVVEDGTGGTYQRFVTSEVAAASNAS